MARRMPPAPAAAAGYAGEGDAVGSRLAPGDSRPPEKDVWAAGAADGAAAAAAA